MLVVVIAVVIVVPISIYFIHEQPYDDLPTWTRIYTGVVYIHH